MSEWWTYSLSSFLLFSPATWYRLFELYNREIWPLQLLALGAGIAMLPMLRAGAAWQGRAMAAILAAAWLWVAWAFHLQRYATINWAASYLAALFALQAVLLLGAGVVRSGLRFRVEAHPAAWGGVGLYLFALLAQPLLGPVLSARAWVQAESFAMTPDPTAVGTLGLLLLAGGRWVWLLMPIPLLWCVIGGATLWALGSPEALVMPVAGLLVLLLAGWKLAVPSAACDRPSR